MAAEQLRGRLRAGRRPIEELPLCVYGRLTREMLESLRQDVAEVRSRVNWLLFGLAAAVAMDFASRLLEHMWP